MKNFILTILLLTSVMLSAQADFKAEARQQMDHMLKVLTEADPNLGLDMKDERMIMNVLMARQRHFNAIDAGTISATEEELATLKEGYQTRIHALLGEDRVAILSNKKEAEEEQVKE